MTYRVELADQAKSDLLEIYSWIAQDSAAHAARWVVTLESAIRGLDLSPERCAVAPENEEPDIAKSEFEIRQLLIGHYRVLFVIRERMVLVLHIRHGSRRTATREEIAGAIREGQELEPE